MASNTEGLPVALGAGVTVAAAAAAADEAADILLHAHAHALNRMRRRAGTVAWTVASSFGGPGKTQIKPASVRACLVASEWRSRWVGGHCAHNNATLTSSVVQNSASTAHLESIEYTVRRNTSNGSPPYKPMVRTRVRTRVRTSVSTCLSCACVRLPYHGRFF